MFDEDVLELNLHGRADVNLHRENAVQRAALFIQIDQVGGGTTVDPVLVMVAANEDPEIVPLTGFWILDRHRADDPWLTIGIDNHFFASVRKDSASAFFVKHAVVFRLIGDDITLISR